MEKEDIWVRWSERRPTEGQEIIAVSVDDIGVCRIEVFGKVRPHVVERYRRHRLDKIKWTPMPWVV